MSFSEQDGERDNYDNLELIDDIGATISPNSSAEEVCYLPPFVVDGNWVVEAVAKLRLFEHLWDPFGRMLLVYLFSALFLCQLLYGEAEKREVSQSFLEDQKANQVIKAESSIQLEVGFHYQSLSLVLILLLPWCCCFLFSNI